MKLIRSEDIYCSSLRTVIVDKDSKDYFGLEFVFRDSVNSYYGIKLNYDECVTETVRSLRELANQIERCEAGFRVADASQWVNKNNS